MGINGLSTYLARNPANFEPFHLHNTLVVIDAYNFLNHIYFSHGIYTQFSGEYLHFEQIIRKILRGLRRCAVEPIFVFDGCHEIWKLPTQLRRCRFRLRTCHNLNKLVETHSNPTDGAFCVPILPLLVPIVLAQLLQRLNVRYVVADRESDKEAASLAIHLNCPVISDDSDFYITMPTSVESAVCLIPLRWLSFEPQLQSKNCSDSLCPSRTFTSPQSCLATCAHLSCQKFVPFGPGFRELPPSQRPLFALLAGNDHLFSYQFSALQLFQHLRTPLARKATKEMRINRRRLLYKHLISWLAGYGDNVEECIRRVVSHSPATQREALTQSLLQCLESYNVDPTTTASILSPFLLLNKSSADEEHLINVYCNEEAYQSSSCVVALQTKSISFDSSMHSDAFNGLTTEHVCFNPGVQKITNSDPEGTFSRGDSTLTNRSTSHVNLRVATTDRPLITSHWPDGLVRAFRKFDLFPNFLDALYCRGLVLNCAVEALNQSDSIHTCSAPIRQLVYNLLLGVDAYDEEHQPLLLVEYARKGSCRLKSFKIPVRPLTVRNVEGVDWRYAIIQRFLTHSYEPEPNYSWLHSLALLTSLWHANVSGLNEDPSSCSLILALATIAISCWMLAAENRPKCDKPVKKFKQHLTRCTNSFSEHSYSIGPGRKSSRFLQLHIVHAFGQLQSMYASLITLGAVLDALVPSEYVPTKCINLPKASVLFPSGYLFHSLASCLSLCPPTERIDWVRTTAFAQLLGEREDDVRQSVALLEHFIHWLCLLRQHCVSVSPCISSTVLTPHDFSSGVLNTRLTSSGINKKSKRKSKRHKITPHTKTMAQITADVERIMLENGLTE